METPSQVIWAPRTSGPEDRTVTVSAEITYDYPAPYNVFGKRSVSNT